VKRILATLALAAVALAAAACSATVAGEPPAGTPAPADPDAIVVVADQMRFEQAEVVVPAGAPFQLTFENRESPPHNVAIYTDASASTPMFQGEIFSSGTRVYEVPALDAGTYAFRCDVHPDMTGTIVAK
jgi:plastocyanin